MVHVVMLVLLLLNFVETTNSGDKNGKDSSVGFYKADTSVASTITVENKEAETMFYPWSSWKGRKI